MYVTEVAAVGVIVVAAGVVVFLVLAWVLGWVLELHPRFRGWPW